MFQKMLGSSLKFLFSIGLLSALTTGCYSPTGNQKSNPSISNDVVTPVAQNKNTHKILARQGVIIDYPQTWQTQAYYDAPPLEDEEDISVKPRENSTFFNTVEVIDFLPASNKNVTVKLDIEKLPRSMTLEEAYEEVIKEKLEAYSDDDRLGSYSNSFKDLKLTKLNKSRQEVYEFTYSRFNNEKRIRGKVLFAVNGESDELYILHYQAPETEYEQNFDEINSVIQSFQLVDKDNSVVLIREEVEDIFKSDKFFCGEGYENNKIAPTIFANHHWGNVPVMRFESSQFPDWPPEKRCQEIAKRLTDFYHRGLLVHVEVGYPPKSLLDAAKIYLREESGFSLNKLEEMLQALKPGALATSDDKNDRIPVICISAKALDGAQSHDDLPQKYVALLMTMTHEEDHQAIVASIKSLTTDPQQIVVH